MPKIASCSFRVSLAGALLAAGLALQATAAVAAPAVQEEKFDSARLSLSRFTLQDGAGSPTRYVLSHAGRKAPLVLYVQGSGCIPPFIDLGTPRQSSTLLGWVPLAAQHRYALMAVDKPGQPPALPALPADGQPGQAALCPQAFNAHFSYDSWLATLKTALRHALDQPDVDRSRVLVIGISEGAAMAAGLAHALPEVTHVALVGGPPGATQLYDFVLHAYAGVGNDEDRLRRLQELDATLDAIRADPRSTDKFAWGHTYLRWSSFFAQSHGEDLAQSKARVYMVAGKQDVNVPILSTEVAYARLRGLGRDVTFRRIPGADHGLLTPGAQMADRQKEYDAIIAWFEQR
jgi:pimeloyl-ACP methyl ester carboxylesterase